MAKLSYSSSPNGQLEVISGEVPKTLFISPHSDDVGFSAAGQLAACAEAGAVTVLTLFAHEAEARRAEDQALGRRFGVTMEEGRWPEAPRRGIRSPARLFALPGAAEEPLIAAIAAELQRRVDAGTTRLFAPLAIGHHVDHQIAHLAARRVRGAELHFYEDTPYVLTDYQLSRRLLRLGMAPAAGVASANATGSGATAAAFVELGAYARAWWRMPLLAHEAPPGLRWLAAASLLPREWSNGRLRDPAPLRLTPTLLDSPALLETKLAAIASYPSQWPLFYRRLDGWAEALTRYAAASGHPTVIERSWIEARV